MPCISSPRKRAVLISAVLLAVIAFFTRTLWLPMLADFLVVNQPVEKADAIYVLGGFDPIRAPAAASLFRAGYAPRVLVSAYPHSPPQAKWLNSDSMACYKLLVAAGVPAQEVDVIGTASSTYEEAINLKEYLRRHPVKSLLIVTSHFHSRRVQWTFTRALADQVKLIVVESDNRHFYTYDWWRNSYGRLVVFNEYTKLVYYGLRYRF
jgi:uncharacterized SAM-binding protein YcdF (DUF218 family)